jgi:hypothetical protein
MMFIRILHVHLSFFIGGVHLSLLSNIIPSMRRVLQMGIGELLKYSCKFAL